MFTLSGSLSFSQKNVNVLVTDIYDFTMTVDELVNLINTDSTMNKWTYMESYDSDYFILFNFDFNENKVMTSIDYGDTLSCYKIISKNYLNKKNIHLTVTESEIKSEIVIIYKNEKPYRLIKYRVDGNFAIGYLSKNVSIQ
jgi:hypothetical protein